MFFLNFGKGIFRTLVYSEPKAYSKHCQASTMERFAKIASWRIFRPKLQKIKKNPPGKDSLYLKKWNFLALILKMSYISGNRNPKEIPYISGKWNFLVLILGNFLYFLKRKLFLYLGKWNFFVF